MSVSPNLDAGDVVTSLLTINGAAIPDELNVLEIEVEHAVNRLPVARVIISDGSVTKENFDVSSGDLFLPGKTVEISVGYLKAKPIFKGIIRRHGIRVTPDGHSEFEIGCTDSAFVLTTTRKARLYEDQSDKDILNGLIGGAGLSAKVDLPGSVVPHRLQADASDWDFLMSRADAAGCVVIVSDGTVTVAAPEMGSPVLDVGYGESIASLDIEIDAGDQQPAVTAKSWDYARQAAAEAQGDAPGLKIGGGPDAGTLASAFSPPDAQIRTHAPQSPEALKAMADGRMIKSGLARQRGRVAFIGNALPQVGGTINLKGLGKRFDGPAWVGAVRHMLSSGEWRTEVGFGPAPKPFTEAHRDVSAPPAAGLLPGMPGLQIAKVLQVHEDPLGQHRIKVALPVIENGESGHWVRLVMPFAGVGAGVQFYPEVDDEVVLGFLQGDPEAAIMLGALHSADRAPPFEVDEKNTFKGIVTTSGLKISFEEEKKILKLETPGGHSVTLNDEDKSIEIKDLSDNTLKMSESGIEITSTSDMALKASGDVTIDGANVKIAAQSDAEMTGQKVTANGQMSVTVKGGTQAELTASGTVAVKGTMINLN